MPTRGFSTDLSFSDAGKAVNEDLAGVAGNVAWVLDGATGHRDTPITSGDTDGQWYVERLDAAFRDLAAIGAPLDEIAESAVARVRDEFLDAAPDDLDRGLDVPAAAGVLVRLIDDEIEYLVLGDCTLLAEKPHTVARVTDRRGAPKEQEQIEAMQRQFDAGVDDPWTARDNVEEIFLENKAATNSPGSYWVFSLEPGAVDQALTGAFDLSPELRLHLATDGFTAVVDTYRMYESWERLLGAIRSDGIETIVSEMRELEEGDAALRAYPRTKPSDDATILSLSPTE